LIKPLATFTLALSLCALLAACASKPPVPAPAPAAAKTPLTKEQKTTVLKAMSFEEADDGWRLTLPAPLVFAFDSDAVAESAKASLLRVGRELTEIEIERAMVRGHTDNVGTVEYNLNLSKRRADAIARMLVEGGYAADRIDSKGVGSVLPTATNNSAEGRAQNRRVVIIVQLF
jgi:outer membrane protein OmpA-like peptidoglycan-associated protein